MPEPRTTHPLPETALQAQGLCVRRTQWLGRLSVRSDHPQALTLPTRIGEVRACDWGQWLCLGPNEWQLRCETSRCREIQAQIQAPHHSVDVSDYYVSMLLEGPRARELINKGCPLDLSGAHLRGGDLPVGDCVQSHFSKSNIVLWARSENEIELCVRWSHAEYLWRYFATAMRGF